MHPRAGRSRLDLRNSIRGFPGWNLRGESRCEQDVIVQAGKRTQIFMNRGQDCLGCAFLLHDYLHLLPGAFETRRDEVMEWI